MGKKLDLAGKKFNRLTVIKDCGKVKRGENVKWVCLCDCGNTAIVQGSYLKNGNTKSCGCYKKERIIESNNGGANKLKLSGIKFGRLTVIDEHPVRSNRQVKWNCLCECGNKVVVTGTNLKSGITKSCGCYRIDRIKEANTTHGHCVNLKKTSEFKCWVSMIRRCYDENTKYYKDWGGRGIKVCDRWLHSFENFFEDMGTRPTNRHSLDRFPDKNGNYELSNCRWATYPEQQRNIRSNVWIDYNGKKMILKDWIDFLRSMSFKG